MKKKLITAFCLLLLFAVGCMLATGGEQPDVMLLDYSFSADGTQLTMTTGVASSIGYTRACRARQVNGDLHVVFYSTYGLNSSLGAKNEFTVSVGSCDKVFFSRFGEYDLVLQRNFATGQWERAQ